MQRLLNLSKPAQVFLGALWVSCWVVAAYMYFAGALGQVPLQELPLLYWVMLFFGPVQTLIMAVVERNGSVPLNPSGNRYYAFNLVVSLFIAGVFLLLALVTSVYQPAAGGNTALYLAAGSQRIATIYTNHRRHQVLK